MKKRNFSPFLQVTGLLFLCMLVLVGCVYPRSRMLQNAAPPVQQIKMVQDAVDQYQKDTGVLPIVTKPAVTPEFERYPIDFSRIVPRYIPYIPGAAFEEGGELHVCATECGNEARSTPYRFDRFTRCTKHTTKS